MRNTGDSARLRVAGSDLRQYLLHPARRRLAVLAVARLEPGDDATAIVEFAILAELDLGLHALELHAEGDDVLGLLHGVAGRQAAQAPGLGAAALIDCP